MSVRWLNDLSTLCAALEPPLSSVPTALEIDADHTRRRLSGYRLRDRRRLGMRLQQAADRTSSVRLTRAGNRSEQAV